MKSKPILSLVIKDAGKAPVQVIDNGLGMMSLMRDCKFGVTSKILPLRTYFLAYLKDLCGEAPLLSLRLRMEMKTKPRPEELGTQIIVEGKFVSQDMAVPLHFIWLKPFFNIPAYEF
jgi:DNA mismatch repair protein MutL